MQLWYSVSPSIYKLFEGLKPRRLSRIILIKRRKKRAAKAKEEANACGDSRKVGGTAESTNTNIGTVSPSRVSTQGGLNTIETRRHSSYQGSPPRTSVNYIIGRNSDVLPSLSRFSTSSSSYERLSVERSIDLPPVVKLGIRSDDSGDLLRQASSTSLIQHRHSTCSSATSFMSVTSSRVKDICLRQKDLLANDLSRRQPHIGELFAGNQFLTHLTAAPTVPAAACENAFLRPSPGLLNSSLSRREAELKDRIILFL
ncbi:hypothetical protein KP509_02G094900 [Ceratopteris richardii]|uniref:Uncharacterized protein n=1 Tax=Ceratopteris richardii TaxID=49495 RepID=A0A8T2VBY0_CERRI|nr:hypothetical protein KP509_02G094900 [Ceratopteris richardii]KAH7444872.1 hypothetical protein KP509_02G094900 [Ceratopteris richardii]